jgi:hypothetical protein
MRKLTQTYAWSATQLNALERPKLPPPPDAFLPPDPRRVGESGNVTQPSASRVDTAAPTIGGATPLYEMPGNGPAADASTPRRPATASSLEPDVSSVAYKPHMEVDSVATLPSKVSHVPTDSVGGTPVSELARHGNLQPGAVPPAVGNARGPSPTQARGRAVEGSTGQVRGFTGSARQSTTATGGTGSAQPAVSGRLPASAGRAVPAVSQGRPTTGAGNGIVGGRPVPPSAGRTTGAIPRGIVVGGESPRTRGATGTAGRSTNAPGRVVTQSGQNAGRTPVAPRPGVVGGRPMKNGIVGADRQLGQTGERPSGSGTTATPGAVGASRNGVGGGTPPAVRPAGGPGIAANRNPGTTSPRHVGSTGHQNETRPQRRAKHRDEAPGQHDSDRPARSTGH